jgi:hypothetical protein
MSLFRYITEIVVVGDLSLRAVLFSQNVLLFSPWFNGVPVRHVGSSWIPNLVASEFRNLFSISHYYEDGSRYLDIHPPVLLLGWADGL